MSETDKGGEPLKLSGAANETYRKIFQTLQDGILLVDNDGYVVDANQAFLDLYQVVQSDIVGKVRDTLGKTEDPGILPSIGSTETLHVQSTITRGEGEVPVDIIIHPLVEGDKRIGFIEVHHEIKREKELERALQASTELEQEILEHISAGACVVDLDENIQYVNPHMTTIFEVPQENLIGANIGSFVTPETFRRIREETDRRIRGEHGAYDFELQLRSGTKKIVHVEVCPRYDAQHTCIGSIALIRDLTDKRRNEELLRQSEERFRTIFEQSPIVLLLINTHGVITDINPHGIHLSGYGKEELVGKNVRDLPVLPDASKSIAHEQFTKRLTETIPTPYELEFVTRDGTNLTGLVTGTTLRDAEGDLLSVLAIVSDITDLKKQAETDLLIQLGRIAAGVSHQLNNQLQVIEFGIEIFRQRCPDIEHADKDHFIATLSSVREAALQVQQLRYYTGKVFRNRERLNLRDLLQQKLDMFQPLLSKKNITLRLTTSEVPDVFVNKDHILDMIVYLIRFSLLPSIQTPGDISLTISEKAADLPTEDSIFQKNQSHAWVEITYTDSRLAIEEDSMKKIFEPFAPLKPYLPIDGAILNLTAVKAIVETNGGHIYAVPRENTSGLTIHILFPVISEADPMTNKTPGT